MISVGLLLLASLGAPDSTLKPEERTLIAALREDIPQILRLVGTPGLNLAIARRGEVIYEDGFGSADLERKIPMTAATVTHSGSMGKTYTAIAVMQLVEQGRLALDAPVNQYLSGWQIVNPLGGRDVTVRDLLTHRSGLAGNGAWSTLGPPKPIAEHVPEAYRKDHNDFYGGATTPTWTAQAGEKYQYSNLGIATLGYLVEVVNPEKLTFSQYVQRHLIDPLGMTSTQFPPVQDSLHIRPDIWTRLSRGYAGMGPLRIPTPAIYFEDHPAGTIVTKPSDHVRVLLAMQHEGRYHGYQLLKPETVRQMLTPEVEIAPGSSVGLVWSLQNWNGPRKSFGHAGAHMWGWTNRYLDFPDQDLAIAVFMNQWSLPDDPLGARYKEANLVIDFVRSWLEHGAARATPPPKHSWAWKVSYVAGLMMVEHVNGALGIEERLSPAAIDAMVRGAAPRLDRSPSVWDPAGFRAGVADLSAVPRLTPATIAAFLQSDRLPVVSEELPIIHLELGGRGSLPAPE